MSVQVVQEPKTELVLRAQEVHWGIMSVRENRGENRKDNSSVRDAVTPGEGKEGSRVGQGGPHTAMQAWQGLSQPSRELCFRVKCQAPLFLPCPVVVWGLPGSREVLVQKLGLAFGDCHLIAFLAAKGHCLS